MTVPPGWPEEVPPPGAPDWERRAVGWLLDLCPPDFRGYDVLLRHPAVLARFAARYVAAALDATRAGLAAARTELAPLLGPDGLPAAIDAYEREEARLTRAARAIPLVERAVKGPTEPTKRRLG